MTTTPDREALLSLADRCEKAEGPDRELDALIARSALGRHIGIAKFTASLDAAMTLVPEGWKVATFSQTDGGTWWAELRKDHITSYSAVAMTGYFKVATPALALTAACLRALAGDRP